MLAKWLANELAISLDCSTIMPSIFILFITDCLSFTLFVILLINFHNLLPLVLSSIHLVEKYRNFACLFIRSSAFWYFLYLSFSSNPAVVLMLFL